MTLREFKMGNFVLIGSRRGVPWVQLFEPQLNFSMEEDHASRQMWNDIRYALRTLLRERGSRPWPC
jgi:hypothetical protein